MRMLDGKISCNFPDEYDQNATVIVLLVWYKYKILAKLQRFNEERKSQAEVYIPKGIGRQLRFKSNLGKLTRGNELFLVIFYAYSSLELDPYDKK